MNARYSDSEIIQILGERLRMYRIALGLTKAELSAKAGGSSEADSIQLGRNNAVRSPAGIIRDVRKGIALFVEAARRNGVDAFHIELIAGRLAELNPELGITVAGQAAFSFTSSDGTQVENVRFERTESGNIHILARIGDKNAKYVVTPKKALYREILVAGFNAMPDGKKEELARKYLLREGR